MLIEYYNFRNGEEKHKVEIDIEEDIYGDNLEEIQIINQKISEAANLPIGTFKFRRVL
ncbi:hypothetical protein [Lysinibacillus sp. UBA5990]|uniref:hypothetical protein n=1 Tax=Lysinibacillus sp. UBA5990 TaxID=1946773 RepID=UPI0025C241CF|nr:hypothetical protein [Lysinibacillus sp. UBA5990]